MDGNSFCRKGKKFHQIPVLTDSSRVSVLICSPDRFNSLQYRRMRIIQKHVERVRRQIRKIIF